MTIPARVRTGFCLTLRSSSISNHQNPDGGWAVNPFGPADPFANQAEVQTPEEVSRFIGGGNIDWSVFSV